MESSKRTRKIGGMNEAAWVVGIVVCALGVALCTKADFGLSMIAAPPFILHYALRGLFPWFTQGTAEYVWQGVLLLLMCAAVQRFRWRYLLSFGTAVIAGLAIDGWLLLHLDQLLGQRGYGWRRRGGNHVFLIHDGQRLQVFRIFIQQFAGIITGVITGGQLQRGETQRQGDNES